MTDPDLLTLAKEIAGLRDLFQRRLLEDRDKRRLYDELVDLANLARQDLNRQFVAPIARELLLMLDRIDSLDGTDPGMVLDSIRLEIVEILARRGIERFETLGEVFDPRIHEACGKVESPADQANRVVQEVRAGWTFGPALLRPARVVVGTRPRKADGG